MDPLWILRGPGNNNYMHLWHLCLYTGLSPSELKIVMEMWNFNGVINRKAVFWLTGISVWEQRCLPFSLVNSFLEDKETKKEIRTRKDCHSREFRQNHKMCFWLLNVYPRHHFEIIFSVYSPYGTCTCIQNKIYFDYTKPRARCTWETNVHGSAYKKCVLCYWIVFYLST